MRDLQRRRLVVLTVAAMSLSPVAFLAPPAVTTLASSLPAATPPSAGYVVKRGDSIQGIARTLGVTVSALLTANKLKLTSVIQPGQVLVVPATAPPPSTYVVVAGDTLIHIAARFGVPVTSLLTANGLSLTSVILPGRSLIIPPAGTTPPSATPTTTTAVPSRKAPSTTTTTTTTTAPAVTSSYVVRAGDSLGGIARRTGVTLTALLAANSLTATSLIVPGQSLVIPAAPTSGSTPPTTVPKAPPAVVGTTPSGSTTSTTSTTTTTTTSTTVSSSPPKPALATLLAFLRAQVGKPYVFDTAGPDTYDCSGLVTAAFAQIGINLPHQSRAQSAYGTAVDWTTQPLLPGDLIFQATTSAPNVISHVGVVVDAKHWIEAARPGVGVSLDPIPASAKITAVRRILSP